MDDIRYATLKFDGFHKAAEWLFCEADFEFVRVATLSGAANREIWRHRSLNATATVWPDGHVEFAYEREVGEVTA